MMVTDPANYSVWFVLVFQCQSDWLVDMRRSQIVTIILPADTISHNTIPLLQYHHHHHTTQGNIGSHVNTNIFDILLTDGVIRTTLWHQDLTEELGGWRFPWRYLKMNYSFSFQLYFMGFRVYVSVIFFMDLGFDKNTFLRFNHDLPRAWNIFL